ncbi:hypothetical protein [Crossiella sp. CA198]|uniref:hypothetical protein n=1 Tax=Crossiella sp. CA198 TaxID=3455607 RepID=UPI003F8CF50B
MADRQRALPVAADLLPWIAGIGMAELGTAEVAPALTTAPDTAASLVYRAEASGPGELMVLGPRTKAAYFTRDPGTWCLSLSIRPGRGQLLFGRSVRVLTDRAVPLRAWWGGSVDDLVADLAGLAAEPLAEPGTGGAGQAR